MIRTLIPAVCLFASAAAYGQQFTISSYQLIAETRLGRSEFLYEYRASVTNTGPAAVNVTATLTSLSAATIVVDGSLAFGAVGAGATVASTDTFTVRHDRNVPWSFANLQWAFSSNTANHPPAANAGPDQTGPVGALITLNGAGSSDADGNPLTYAWSMASRPAGSAAALSNATAVNPSFTLDRPGTYLVQLIVNDGTVNSPADTVQVSTINSAPVANAGPDQTLTVGSTAPLNGSASSDADGNPLTYQWSFTGRPAGSAATLSNTTLVNPTFVIDRSGSYVLQLIVNDGTVNSLPDSITITTLNSPPVANAGPDQSQPAGSTVQLNGSGSTDVDGNPLTYAWSLTSRPAGSTATLTGATLVNPTFVIDVSGTYIAQLIVNDGFVPSAPDTVSITTSNSAPTANAGPDQAVVAGATVFLNGSASSDADGNALTYAWSFQSRPAGSTATLSGATSVAPTFAADRPGTFVVQLIVNDGFIGSAPDTVMVSTSNTPPVANAGPDQTVNQGATVSLTGAGSSDADGHPLTFSWSLISQPAGGSATVTNPTSASASFAAALAGTYVAQLIVNDGFISSAPDTVMITANAVGQITVTLAEPLVGAGRTVSGTVTLNPAPPGGAAVQVTSNNTGLVTVSPATVNIPAGQSSGGFTVTGVSPGGTTIDAAAAGYATGSVPATCTSNLISLGALGTLSPGQSVGLAVSLNSPAGPGGVTINFNSADTSIATVTASVFIAQGAQVPTVNPQVTGVNAGSTTITATAAGYATDNRTATVALTISFSSATLQVPVGNVRNNTLNLSGPAPAGGLTFTIGVDNTAAATAPSSVQIPAGQTSAPVPITGVSVNTTTLRANASGFTEATATIQVVNLPAINLGDATVGRDLQISLSGTLGAGAPPGGVDVTLTSANPSALLLSTNPGVAGSASISINVGAGATSIPVFYAQALAATGTATFTASAPGYADHTSTVTFAPSGFTIDNPGNFTTNTFAANRTISVSSARLNPATLALATFQAVRGGITVNVDVTSSNPSAGSITTSPVVFTSGAGTVTTAFDPQAAGTTTIAVGTPGGFSTPTNFQQITATVTAPDINFSDQTVGRDLQVAGTATLASAPPSPVSVTATSSDPAIVTLSTVATAAGGGSVTFPSVAGTTVGIIYVQGRGIGTATVTLQAAGYADHVANITVDPSGFVIETPGNFTTNTFAANTSILIAPARLNPATLNLASFQTLRGGLSVNVDVTSGTTATGTITTSPLAFTGNLTDLATAFDPQAAGTSVISVVPPAGFSTPNNSRQITATVTAPAINFADQTVGRDLQVAVAASLASAPPSPVSVTATSSDSAIVTLSTVATAAGGASLTFPSVAGTSIGTIYVQGRGTGTATVTLQAAGYADRVANITVDPSGFTIESPGNFTTNTFAANSSILIASTRLNPVTLNVASFQAVRGGLTVNVDVTSSNTSAGTITASPVTIGAGQDSAFTAFDPQSVGTSVISAVTPAGFSTPNNSRQITATVTAPAITMADTTVGLDLQSAVSITLASAPPSPVTVTITSSSAAISTISSNSTLAGTNTVVFTNVSSTNVGQIFVQGRGIGGTTLTAQAAGYADATASVTVDPSGFVIDNPGNFTRTAGAANVTVSISSARLNAATLNVATFQAVRGGLSVNVDVTSSNPAVGTITTSPVAFSPGQGSVNTQFDPAAQGTSTITVQTPAGFSTPSNLRQITATITP